MHIIHLPSFRLGFYFIPKHNLLSRQPSCIHVQLLQFTFTDINIYKNRRYFWKLGWRWCADYWCAFGTSAKSVIGHRQFIIVKNHCLHQNLYTEVEGRTDRFLLLWRLWLSFLWRQRSDKVSKCQSVYGDWKRDGWNSVLQNPTVMYGFQRRCRWPTAFP